MNYSEINETECDICHKRMKMQFDRLVACFEREDWQARPTFEDEPHHYEIICKECERKHCSFMQ